ncbi:hypothetical protein [Pseudomonas sp.]|uniref:DUF7079 family protein n=1 Tax=Pseudomonas sp. TaxID=306 RepID=UPI0023559648|nr:hypothetical protein [Pseudomonas sp.]
MGSVLTHAERIRLWSALSDAFVDNPVDYAAIARQLEGIDRATVKVAFFEEVAPVCYSNLQAPIPPIWTAFDTTWLAETIRNTQEARRASALRRLRDQAFVAYLRYRLKDEWQCIERELERQRHADAG